MRSEQSKAVIPHELLIFNLLIFNIGLPILALLTHMERTLLPVAITCSLLIILFIRIMSKRHHDTPFIKTHWKVVWRRCRIILIAYSISLSIEMLSSFMASFQTDPQLAKIMTIAFTRVAIVPTLLVVTPLLIMSTITTSRILRGKIEA